MKRLGSCGSWRKPAVAGWSRASAGQEQLHTIEVVESKGWMRVEASYLEVLPLGSGAEGRCIQVGKCEFGVLGQPIVDRGASYCELGHFRCVSLGVRGSVARRSSTLAVYSGYMSSLPVATGDRCR